MSINIGPPQVDELKPRIAVIGVGGAGGNAIANAGTVSVTRVAFPAGDYLIGDGTNLFYVNAAKTITNNLTGNTP